MTEFDPIAVYGAVLASFLAWREWRRDRSTLRFHLEMDYPDATEEDLATGNFGLMYWRLWVTNVGKRPVNVVHVGLLGHVDYSQASADLIWASDSRHRLPMVKTPALLAEGDSACAGSEEEELVDKLLFSSGGPQRVVGAYAVDTTGRRFTFHTGRWRDQVVGNAELDRYRRALRNVAAEPGPPWWVRTVRRIRRLLYLVEHRVPLS